MAGTSSAHPGLTDIPALVGEIGEAGMEIQADVQTPAVAPEVGRAAYRVVQEALTNVAKHAPGAATSVRVGESDGWLEVEVVNSPAHVPVAVPSGTGSGLKGIHQRVAILGGHSDAGPTAEGGFGIRAAFPTVDGAP